MNRSSGSCVLNADSSFFPPWNSYFGEKEAAQLFFSDKANFVPNLLAEESRMKSE